MASMNTRSRFPGLVHPMVVPVVLPRTMFSGAGDHRFYRISLTCPPVCLVDSAMECPALLRECSTCPSVGKPLH